MTTETRSPRADAYESVELRLRLPMLLLSVAVIPVLAISLSQSHLSRSDRQSLDTIDYTIWTLFTVEYLLLLVLAPSRGRYVRTHVLELLLVVLPFLRPLRVVRSARALRVLRMARLGVVGGAATQMARKKLASSTALFAAVAAVTITIVGSVLVLDVEQRAKGSNIHNLGDAIWWGATTITTVGYGDRFPVTAAGRAVAVVLMLTGIALLGVVTAALASWFVKETSAVESQSEVAELRADIARLTVLVERQLAASAGRPGSA
jgi:voltage-gated potassium channel